MKNAQVKELVLQSLEHERGGVKVYEAALQCATNEELREEWQNYLQQTRRHVQALTTVCSALGLDSEEQTPGCQILHKMGGALVASMEEARSGGNAEAAQLVACECVVLAETKDHLDWELLGEVAKELEERSSKRCAAPTSKSKMRRMSICTTPAAGAESCGSSRWA